MLYALLALLILATVAMAAFLFLRSESRLVARGYRLEKDGRHDDAYLAYEQAVRLDPTNCEARWRLANLAFGKGAYTRAVSELQAALAMKELPEGVREDQVRYQLGRCYLMLDSLANAFVEFYKAVQYNPSHAGALVQLGVIYAGQGKHDRAVKHLARAVDIDPGNGDAHYYLGLVNAEQGDFSAAIACLEKAIKAQPHNVEASFYLGVFYRDKKMLVEAIRRLQHAVSATTDPEIKLEGYRMLGMCYKEKGLVDEAITHYQTAAVASKDHQDRERHKDILYNLGMAYTKKGEADKAVATWMDLQRVDGSYKDVEQLIAKSNRGFDRGEFDATVASWERISDREGTRIRSAGLLRSKKRFDVERLARELGGDLDEGAEPKPGATDKPIVERFLELNNKQFFQVAQRMLQILGFAVARQVDSAEDSDFEEGKAVAFIADRRDPRTRQAMRYLVQVRRWRENVGPIPIGNCMDMMEELRVQRGLFMVSATYTEAALAAAKREPHLQLVDRRGMITVLKKILK